MFAARHAHGFGAGRHACAPIAPAPPKSDHPRLDFRSPAMIHDSILGTVGNTPIVRINRLAPSHVTMYVKCEAFNPMSSVKDRLALGIILDAEARGELKPGQMVVEATSGNTGIALAMVCAVRGYPFVAFM